MLSHRLILATALVLGAMLIGGHTYTAWLTRRHPERRYGDVQTRLKAWWWMLAALLLSFWWNASLLFFAGLSFIALREFLSRADQGRLGRMTRIWLFAAIPLQYILISQGWTTLFYVFAPIWAVTAVVIQLIIGGRVQHFIWTAAVATLGVLIAVYSPGFVASLSSDPRLNDGAATALFLVLIVQFNDVAQFCWGRSLGRRKILPSVSPNKTWEGFIGGAVTTALVATVVAPAFTHLPHGVAFGLGAAGASLGFFGDLFMSAIKRDVGIKDFSALIPGHGGVLDRIDSLVMTMPVFSFIIMEYGTWLR